MNFFTADTHFGHANIIKYCNRYRFMNLTEKKIMDRNIPEEIKNLIISKETLDKHDSTIIRNWNERVKDNDTVYILGDWCFRNSLGGKKGEGSIAKAEYYINQLNGRKVFIRGNHDSNNGVKSIITCAVLNSCGKSVFIQHIPPERKEEIPNFCNLVLCGHVHEKWRLGFVDDIPIINTGVDVWNFYPVTLQDILRVYSPNYIKRLHE